MSSQRTNIAVVGFGMSGIAFTSALRHAYLFTSEYEKLSYDLTVFEAMLRVGGKMAPENLGAQFVDARHFYPVSGPNGLIARHALKTYPPREDYDACNYVTESGVVVPAARFLECLNILRAGAKEALETKPWNELDQKSALEFVQLHRERGIFSDHDTEAMLARLGFEEGTYHISLLSWAMNLAKSESPMPRLEIVGGFHALAEAERRAVLQDGHRILTGACVSHIAVTDLETHLTFVHEDKTHTEKFDYVVLALAPEHYKSVKISGTCLPLASIAALKPACITKANVCLKDHTILLPEVATHRYAKWNDIAGETSDVTRTNFFHGWEGSAVLSSGEMLRHALGEVQMDIAHSCNTQTWDGGLVEGTPHAYTTMPLPGQGYDVLKFALQMYFTKTFDNDRLKVAGQVLGLGCYTRDSALSGEWAAVAVLRSLGCDVARAFANDPVRLFTGVAADVVAMQWGNSPFASASRLVS